MSEYLKFLVPFFAGVIAVLLGHFLVIEEVQYAGVGAIIGSFATLRVPNYSPSTRKR